MLRIDGYHLLCGCLSVLLILGLACDAPRDNPLDPKNPEYKYGTIYGSVQTFCLPHRPIPLAEVTWGPDHRSVRADANGQFVIDDILPNNGALYFHASGYRADSVAVQWTKTSSPEIVCFLNQIPQLQQSAVFSSVLNRYPNLRTFQLTVQAWVQDPDQDIESVNIEAQTLGLHRLLVYNPSEKIYQDIFSPYDLALPSLQSAVGKTITISVTDLFGFTYTVGQTTLVRIIMDEVSYVQPSSYQITASRPKLQWKKFQPGFTFSYILEVYTDEIVPVRVWEKKNLAADLTEFEVDRELPSGDYFWVIWCVDEFGNRSRSKPASFTVP